jgi:hypothetical protein
MSTVEKGTVFEKKVHGILQELLEKDELGISGKYFTIFHQKAFHHPLRGNDIKFDLVIEFYRKEGVKPVFYVLVECKDYGSPVPVGELEKFYENADRVFFANFKSMVFTTNSLQEGAFNYAISTGMAVIRILDDDSRTWLVERANKNLTTSLQNAALINVTTALTNEYYLSTKHDTFATFNFKNFGSVKETFAEVLSMLESVDAQNG